MPHPDNSVARRAEDIIHVLRERIALLPGARDREKRPIIFVPARENSSQVNPDHLRNLFMYLFDVTADDVKELGFVIVIDMRKGTTWGVIKPILKCLQEFFPGKISIVYIIKSDSFWEKHKASVSMGKFKFEIQSVGAESLTKTIDANQVLREFGGCLYYDHDAWLELRVDIERLVWRASDMLRYFEKYDNIMASADVPIDVGKAEELISNHQKLHSLIAALSIEAIEADVEQLKERIHSEHEYLPSSPNGALLTTKSNPDLSSIYPHLVQLIKTLTRTKSDVSRQWELKKQELDQCYQFKLFEQDAENAHQWIRSQSLQLSHRFTSTGTSDVETERLLAEHMELANVVDKYEISYKHVIDMGKRLLKLQSFVVNTIDALICQLENEWQSLKSHIEQRTRLLNLALNVHRKCTKFLKSYASWIDDVGVDPSKVTDKSHDELSMYLEEHDNFERAFETVYTEAYADATQLSKMMKRIFGDNVGQAQSYKQLLELMQRVTHAKRQLHSIWKSRRETIHYRISSAVFASDMRSVIDWLEQHGEPFLRRKIAIGHDRASSNSLNINHENFRNVAMNTYRNANQLFAMAQELKNAGEVDDEQTTHALAELRSRIDNFRRKVDMRTNLLFVACNFFTHYDEIMAWYRKLDDRSKSLTVIPKTVEECERNKEKLQTENDGTLQAYGRVIAEAEQLLVSLQQQRTLLNVDNSESIRHIENLMRNIDDRHTTEKDRWPVQRLYLNTAGKIAAFIRDCDDLHRQILSWREDLKGLKHQVSSKADIVMQYHRQNTEAVRQVVTETMNQMGEIVQMIQNQNLQLVLDDRKTMAQDVVISSANQLRQLEKDVMEIAKDVTNTIEHSLHINKLSKMANEVTNSIQQLQARFHQMNYIPCSLEDANQAHSIHQQFRTECDNVEGMLRNFYEKFAYADFTIDPAKRHMLDKVKSEWSQIIGMTENRSKLINNSIIYYKCASHVMPVSESMERDLRKDQTELCLTEHREPLEKLLEIILNHLNMHTSRKERFLEASLYAQRTSDILLKYIRRCGAPEEHMLAIENEVMTFKQSVRERQARILELWVQRKARLEQCQQAVLLQISCAQICRWVAAETEHCVSMIGQARAATKALRNRNSIEDLMGASTDFKTLVKEKRYEVKQMLQHASRFHESGPNEIHAQVIEQSVQSVRSRFKQILALSDELEAAITHARGEHNGGTTKEDLSLDRYSDSTIEEKMNHKEAVETVWNRKIMEPMNELIRSEKDYIEDLRKCMDIYIREYQMLGSPCPPSLRNKQVEIFGNIDQLYEFHSKTFLSELLAYEKNPEDVGYCFIQWMEKLKELYADYCLNRDESNAIIGMSDAIKIFSDIRERHQLEPSHSLQSLLIKPVQRITRYRLMLEQLLKGSTTNSKEIRDAYEVVVNIPKLANDRMHLKNFDSYEQYKVGDFIMQDCFNVYEPKRYFKPNREMQVFLFESNIIFTKREEIAPKKIRYVYKDSMLLCEIHVVEHVEGDNTKFGLRKGTHPHHNDMTSVLKASSETSRMLWVKTLRDLKMDMKKPSIIDDRIPNFNRISQLSRESNTTTEDRNSIASTSSQIEQYVIGEDFVATSSNANGNAMHDSDQQLSVTAGQRVEVLDRLPDNPEQFVLVAIVEEESGLPAQRRGLVPVRILQPANEAPHQTEASTSTDPGASTSAAPPPGAGGGVQKRTSLRRFFNNSHNNQQNPPANNSAARLSSSNDPAAPNGAISTTPAVDTSSPPAVLSAPGPSSLGSSSATSATQQQSASTDPDLPPPMNELNSTTTMTAAANEINSFNSVAGCSTTTEMNESASANRPTMGDLAQSNPDASGAQADEQPTSAAGTPQGAFTGNIAQMSPEDAARVKREYVIKELVETERLYVQDLSSVVEGYIANLSSLELPEDLQGKDKIIFANIAQINDFHKTIFLKEIEKCLENYEAAGNAFVKYERRLSTYYVKYCQNKPKSDFLVSQESFDQFFAETKQQLGHKVALCDLLIKPVQRITKYQLMLADVLKYTQRAGDRTEVLEKALDVMRIVPKACDDMMQVGRLQNFEGNLNAQGRLLFQGTLQISDGGPNQPFRGKERRVFLFEQSAIIADCIPPRKEYGNPTYIFKNQIMVNKMVLEENVPDEPLRFILTSNDPSQPAVFIAQASSMDDKEKWLQKISAQLDQQKTFLAALVDPKKYQNQLASSVGSLSLSGKKDSSGSLGTPCGASSIGSGAASPKQHAAATATKSTSKLFGFGKSK